MASYQTPQVQDSLSSMTSFGLASSATGPLSVSSPAGVSHSVSALGTNYIDIIL